MVYFCLGALLQGAWRRGVTERRPVHQSWWIIRVVERKNKVPTSKIFRKHKRERRSIDWDKICQWRKKGGGIKGVLPSLESVNGVIPPLDPIFCLNLGLKTSRRWTRTKRLSIFLFEIIFSKASFLLTARAGWIKVIYDSLYHGWIKRLQRKNIPAF